MVTHDLCLSIDLISSLVFHPLLSSSFSHAIKLSQVFTSTYSSHDDFAWEQQDLAQDKLIEGDAHVQV
jgi:hypothetical protein